MKKILVIAFLLVGYSNVIAVIAPKDDIKRALDAANAAIEKAKDKSALDAVLPAFHADTDYYVTNYFGADKPLLLQDINAAIKEITTKISAVQNATPGQSANDQFMAEQNRKAALRQAAELPADAKAKIAAAEAAKAEHDKQILDAQQAAIVKSITDDRAKAAYNAKVTKPCDNCRSLLFNRHIGGDSERGLFKTVINKSSEKRWVSIAYVTGSGLVASEFQLVNPGDILDFSKFIHGAADGIRVVKNVDGTWKEATVDLDIPAGAIMAKGWIIKN